MKHQSKVNHWLINVLIDFLSARLTCIPYTGKSVSWVDVSIDFSVFITYVDAGLVSVCLVDTSVSESVLTS